MLAEHSYFAKKRVRLRCLPTRLRCSLVLEGGALPLHVLGQRVEEWAKAAAAGVREE